MKHYHAEAINRAMRLNDTKFLRAEFLSAFDGIRKDTFKKITIHFIVRGWVQDDNTGQRWREVHRTMSLV
jgi:hypothetical protein